MPERVLICVVAVVLVGCTSRAEPSRPLATSTLQPTPSASAAVLPSATSAAPSPSESPATPSPEPSPSPDAGGLEVLDVEVTGCPGGVVLDWEPAATPEFHHYTALRSLEADVATDYPPIAPAVDWGDSYATDRFVTSAVDATLIPSELVFHYRVMAYDEDDRAVAASSVRRARPTEAIDLGPLVVETAADGATRIDWRLFGGLPSCFSAYRVLVGPQGTTPGTTLTVVSGQSTTELETAGLHAGASYAVRVEALRTTTLGGFVVARTETASYTVP